MPLCMPGRGSNSKLNILWKPDRQIKQIFHPHSAAAGKETQTALSATHEDEGAEKEGSSEELMKNLKDRNF